VPEVPDEPDVPDVPLLPDVPDEPEVPDVPSKPEVPDVPLLPDEPDEPDVPEVPLLPDEPDEPVVPLLPPVPEEPTAAAIFLLSNRFVTLFQITTSSDEPVGKLFNCIELFAITGPLKKLLPVTPKLPLIVSDAFIVWSVLICKNDDVSDDGVFNANNA
jgi:hypothetical protein